MYFLYDFLYDISGEFNIKSVGWLFNFVVMGCYCVILICYSINLLLGIVIIIKKKSFFLLSGEN